MRTIDQLAVLVFEADTHLSYVWGYDDTVITEYSSRFGSLANDAFYVLDDVTDSLVKLGESPAPAMALNLPENNTARLIPAP